MFDEFVKEVAYSLNPLKYKTLIENSPWKATKFMLKILLIFFLIMSVLLIPKLNEFQDSIRIQLLKVESVHVSGNFSVREPITIPENEPLLIVDTTGKHNKIKDEKLLLTKDGIQVKTITDVIKINYSDFSQFNKVSEQVSQVIFFAAILILPTIMIFLYLILFLKYLFIALSLSFLFYILLDLAFFQTKFKRIFTTALYSTILFIPVELIFIGINEEYLIPIQDFYKIKIYLLTGLIYLVFFLINSIVVCYYVKKLSQEW